MRGQMQYRLSFVLQLLGVFAINALELAAIFILFEHFETLGGWTSGEIAFLYSLSVTSFGLAKVLGAGFESVGQQIVRGDFDRVLVRPISPFLQLLSYDIKLHQIGRLLQGVLAFCLSMTLVDIDWTTGRLIHLPITILSAAMLFLALFTFEATICFWTTQSTEAVNAFTYGGTTLAQYPLHVFDAWLRRLFLWFIPLGFTIYLPSLYLLDKSDPLEMPVFTHYIAPVVAGLFWVVAGACWRLGISRYRSTGS
jgi:ABC-2 type transport system permease protein